MSFIWLWRDSSVDPTSSTGEFNVEWRPFDAHIQQTLTTNETARNRKSKVQFKIGQTAFEADLDRMIQRNLKSGFSRRITVFVATAPSKSDKKNSSSHSNWRWLDVNGSCWHSYPANLTSQLEVNFQQFIQNKHPKQLVISTGDNVKITVDFESMSARKKATLTKVKREVVADMTNRIKEEPDMVGVGKAEAKETPVKGRENEENDAEETAPVRNLRKRKPAPAYYEENQSDGETKKVKRIYNCFKR